jgi:hypothetical protein
MRMSKLRRVGILACLTIGACAEGESPTDPLRGISPSFSTGQPDLQGTLTVPSPYDPRTTVILGTYPTKTLAAVTIDGVLTLTWDWGPNSGQVYALSDPYGMYHHGQSTCYMNAVVTSSGSGGVAFAPSPCGDMSSSTSFPDLGSRPRAEGFGYFNGEVTATRARKWFQYSSDCGSNPCWTYSGAQEVTVQPLLAELDVTSSASSIERGNSVTITASVAPTHGGALKMPFKINQWRWRPDSGAVVSVCAPPSQDVNPAYCTFAPGSSGTIEVDAIVNGTLQVRTKYVSVLPCLLGDTLLDDARIRRLLRAALDSSFPNAGPLDRRERKFMRLSKPDGSIIDTLYPVGPFDTPCSVLWPASLGGTPIMGGHSHPFEPLSPTDTLPYRPGAYPRSPCPQLDSAAAGPHGSKVGASLEDQKMMGHGYPQLVLEKNGQVWVYPPNYPDANPVGYPIAGPGVCSPLML